MSCSDVVQNVYKTVHGIMSLCFRSETNLELYEPKGFFDSSYKR